MVGVSLKDLTKPRKINGLQAASKVLLFKNIQKIEVYSSNPEMISSNISFINSDALA